MIAFKLRIVPSEVYKVFIMSAKLMQVFSFILDNHIYIGVNNAQFLELRRIEARVGSFQKQSNRERLILVAQSTEIISHDAEANQ